jgi:hypothetical protein
MVANMQEVAIVKNVEKRHNARRIRELRLSGLSLAKETDLLISKKIANFAFEKQK